MKIPIEFIIYQREYSGDLILAGTEKMGYFAVDEPGFNELFVIFYVGRGRKVYMENDL